MAAGRPVSMTNAYANLSSTQAGPIKQGAAVADHAAITAYTAHGSGAVTVTSAAATDLDTTAAALATAVTELASVRAKLNALIAELRTAGVIDT